MKMGLFLGGIWTTLIVGGWVYFVTNDRGDGVIISTILMVATAFIFGMFAVAHDEFE